MFKKFILALLAVASAAVSFAQSNQAFVQKAYWASDWGTWQVQGQTPNTYQFQPASLCQYPQPGGIGIFNAFATNAPVYLQDAEPADSELLTPSFVLINETLCQVSLSPMHNHFSFSLRSGTAGLQEVLNQISAQIPYAVEVYLDRNWYTAVNAIPGQTAASVIASVQGSTAATLVDQTQAPEVYYKWNGSAYVAIAPPSAGIPATTALLAGSGTAGQAAATTAIPNGDTATTQTTSDNTAKVATDAFVQSVLAIGGPPSGAASGILGCTYPAPCLAANATLPNGTAGVTQLVSDTSTKLATDAFVAAVLAIGATPTGTAGGVLGCTYPNPCFAAPPVLLNPSGTQIVTQPAGTTLGINNLNGVYYVSGFTAAKYPGIGVAQTAWSSGTYPLCTSVSSGGNNYIAVGTTTGVTPGTNNNVWMKMYSTNAPTAGDCAFYYSAAQISGLHGVTLVLPEGETDTNLGWIEPTVSQAGYPSLSLVGQGKNVSVLKQTATVTGDTLAQPNAGTAYAFASFTWQGFTVNANFLAQHAVEVYGAQQFAIKDMVWEDAADGTDHYAEFGNESGANHTFGWTYEANIENVDLNNDHGTGGGAVVTASVSAGLPTFTVTSGGGYNTAYAKLVLSGTGSHAANPCTTRGTDTFTFSGNAVATITSTASGCSTPLYAAVYGGANVPYGIRFNDMSDSKTIRDITDGGIGNVAAFYVGNISSQNKFYNLHPIQTMEGVQDLATNDYFDTQMDSVFRYGFDFEGQLSTTNVYATKFEWNTQTQLGSSDYYFGSLSNPPTNAPFTINIYGDGCGNTASFNGYYHLTSSAGSIDDDGTGLPGFVHIYNTTYCNQRATTTPPGLVTVHQILSDGFYGNYFDFNLGVGGNTTVAVTNPFGSGATQGVYTWNLANPTPAASGQNYGSPLFGLFGNLWTGSVSQAFGVLQKLTFAAGSSPAATYQFIHSGTLPSGGLTYSFDNPVTLPTGSTAVTQTTGDNTAKIATDAFVLANGSGVTWPTSADLVLSNGTNTPAGLAPVNGDCVFGAGGAWTAAACPSSPITSVTNTDGTLTISPTTGLVVASLALGHVNTWTGAQAFPSGSTAPTQTTSDTSTDLATDAFVHNNLAPYAPLASPGLTGTPTAPTQSCASNTDIATGAYVANCGTGIWSGLGSPTGNLALTMAAHTSTWTFNAATGTSDLFKLTDAASNTGTGIMMHITTASGSTEIPWQADANGNGWKVDASGKLVSTDTVNNSSYGFGSGSGGDSTCPTPASGSSFFCTKSSGISASINGGNYAPVPGTQVYTVSTLPTASTLPAGTMLVVSDANSFTPGTCTGSGSDYMIAITNGSSWSCH